MRQVVLLLLPALVLPCGCQTLARDVPVVEYSPGGTLDTAVAKYDATYTLSIGTSVSLQCTDVPEGGTVGFRREPDGAVVAFAGEETRRLDPDHGRHVWLCTAKPATVWGRRLVRGRDIAEEGGKVILFVLTLPILIPAIMIYGPP